jgi:hypothetical protein
MIQLPRFPGLERHRSEADRATFVKTIAGSGYDPVGVGAVIEMESAGSWDPAIHGPKAFSMAPGYPIGLIQFSPDTAKSLGTSTELLEQMTFAEQLKFVAAYYDKFGGPKAFEEAGDYYLAGWGAPPGTPNSEVLAQKGSAAYDGNQGLDTNGDGTITAAELRGLVHGKITAATKRGVWSFGDVQTTQSITIRVQNPQGDLIGTATVSDVEAPGLSPLAGIYGAPVMIAYPNGWRFLKFSPEIQIPAKTGLDYTPVQQQSPLSFGWQGGAVIGILGLVATIFFGTLQVQPGRRAHGHS